jgi:hypothetical protein
MSDVVRGQRFEPEVRRLEPDVGSEIRKRSEEIFTAKAPYSGVGSRESESEVFNRRSDVGGRRSEILNQRSDVGDRTSERKKSEVFNQRPVLENQTSDVMPQTTEIKKGFED